MMTPEAFTLDKNIETFYVKATSFPEGISGAFGRLHGLLSEPASRRFFGLSRPGKDGKIAYVAAVQELFPGEGKRFGCENLTIKKGSYTCVVIKDYQTDLQSISKAFDELLKDPDIDPQGYCVEMYLDEKDVRCMVRVIRS